jgi:hypothetical protein
MSVANTLSGRSPPRRSDRVEQHHRDAVRLLARGAAGDPGAHVVARRLVGHEGVEVPAQHVEALPVAQEAGDRDEHRVAQLDELLGARHRALQVLVPRAQAEGVHPLGELAGERAVLVRREVPPRRLARLAGQGSHERVVGPARRALHRVAMQQRCDRAADALGREEEVGDPGVERGYRHVAVRRSVRVLHEHVPARLLHGCDADRAVRPGAGQHDRHGPVAPRRGERGEERVDAGLRADPGERLPDDQRLARHRDIAVGRDDVDGPRAQRLAVGHLDDVEGGLAREHLQQERRVHGRHVLRDDERGTVLGQVRHDVPQRLHAAGGCADADDPHVLCHLSAPLRRCPPRSSTLCWRGGGRFLLSGVIRPEMRTARIGRRIVLAAASEVAREPPDAAVTRPERFPLGPRPQVPSPVGSASCRPHPGA